MIRVVKGVFKTYSGKRVEIDLTPYGSLNIVRSGITRTMDKLTDIISQQDEKDKRSDPIVGWISYETQKL